MVTRRTTTVAALALSLVVLLVAATSGVTAHGWVLDVDDQVSDDGTVVVTKLSAVDHAYVAIHLVEDGSPGRVVGHTHVDHGETVNLEIAIEDDAWANLSGATELVAVVHEDDGKGGFDWPDGNPILESNGETVTSRFTVEKREAGSSRVVATRQESAGNVTIDRVDLARDGFLVLYDDADGERGEVVGVKPLEAGHHENVTVAVDPRYFNQQQSRLYLIAGLHADDGDDVWEPDEDPAITAGDAPVTSAFDAEKTTAYVETPTPTATPTASPTPTPTPPETPSPTVADTVSTTATQSATVETETGTTPTGSPGFGVSVAVVATAVATLLARRRRG